jgi:hypothetical protein
MDDLIVNSKIEEQKGLMELPMNGDFNADKAIEQANKRVSFFKQIKNVSLRMTNIADWTNQNGTPYLGGPGVEKLKPVWGIYFKNIKIEQIPDGTGFIFECKGIAGSRVTGEESEFIGGRNSNDSFFTGKEKQKIVDLMDVRKAAYTNFEVNAVMRLLGMRNLTWEDLKPAGLNQDKANKIDYNSGSQGGQVKGDETIESKREEIRTMLLEISNGDTAIAKNLLIEYTEWTDKNGNTILGKENVKYLTVKQIPVIHKKVSKIYEEWEKEGTNNDIS